MFGSIDPRKMQAMMKQMGIAQEEIPASRVIIEKEGGRIIIESPSVLKIKAAGAETFQISGEAKEESIEEEKEEDKFEQDIKAIVEQTGVNKEIAAIELEKNNGDLAETIITLTEKNKNRKK